MQSGEEKKKLDKCQRWGCTVLKEEMVKWVLVISSHPMVGLRIL